jgi:hypothetical protein
MFKVLATLFLSLTVLTACSDDSEVLIRGKEATVKHNTLVATDTDSYKELKDAVDNDNEQGVMSLEAEGKAQPIDEGTVVTVVDPVAGYHLVKVREADGTEVIINENSLEQ